MKISFPLFFFLLLTYIVSAQDHKNLDLHEPRFTFNLDIGYTSALHKFIEEEPSSPNFYQIRQWNSSWGWGFKIFHKNNWVTSYQYYSHNLYRGVEVFIDIENQPPFIREYKSDLIGSINNNYTFRLGRKHYFKNERWQSNWLVGVNLEFVRRRLPPNFISENSEYFGLLTKRSEIDAGIKPMLQAGYQITYRGTYLGISLMALGNLGVKAHSIHPYTVWIDYNFYDAIIKDKSDFITAMVQFEVYFGNREK